MHRQKQCVIGNQLATIGDLVALGRGDDMPFLIAELVYIVCDDQRRPIEARLLSGKGLNIRFQLDPQQQQLDKSTGCKK